MLEITINHCNEDQPAVVDALQLLSATQPMITFRVKDPRPVDADNWYQILAEGCNWSLDSRQINYDLNIEKAVWWEITNDPNRSDVYTYSQTAQPLHTDNAWFQRPADVNFFLMRRQAPRGGEQTILTVQRLVELLETRNPVLLDQLTSEKVRIAKGTDVEPNVTTILRLEPEPRISWNYYRILRDSDSISSLCDRFFEFLSQLEIEGFVETLRLEDGDALAMADDRVLHGRRSFETTRPRERILLQSMWFTK